MELTILRDWLTVTSSNTVFFAYLFIPPPSPPNQQCERDCDCGSVCVCAAASTVRRVSQLHTCCQHPSAPTVRRRLRMRADFGCMCVDQIYRDPCCFFREYTQVFRTKMVSRCQKVTIVKKKKRRVKCRKRIKLLLYKGIKQ